MINYTKWNVNFITLVISIIIFCLINSLSIAGNENNLNQTSKEKINIQNSIENKVETTDNNISKQNLKSGEDTNKVAPKDYEWQIEIPAISLKAEISEGTSKEVMDKFVGHFTQTSMKTGNVGLAAHNRGYPVNYFENLKKLKENDEIIYKYKDFKKRYFVEKIKIIKDTDWSYLENTEDNVITLITCVENEPEYRRCIQGIERK